MLSPCNPSFIGALGASFLLGLAMPGNAAPLPRDAAYASGELPGARSPSDAELALSGSRLDLLPEASVNAQGQLLGAGRRSNLAETQSFDFGQFRDPATGQFGSSLQDSLRSLVTVRRSSGPAAPANSPRGGNSRQPPDAMGFDLGFTTNEWIRESVEGVMTSVLELSVNERGQASFSVLGFGDFSVIVSGDRSQLAFVSGDDILVSAQRTGYAPQGAGGGTAGGYSGSGAAEGSAVSADSNESPWRRALAFALEIVAHPLMFIVYALIGAYGLVWAVLSNRTRHPRRTGGHRHSHGHDSMAYAHSAAAVPASPPKKVRRRIRVRVRKYR